MISKIRKSDYFLWNIAFNIALVAALAIILLLKLALPQIITTSALKVISMIAIVPVIWGTVKGIKDREANTDLLAAVALIFSFAAGEWQSAAFINLMLSSARIFDLWTQKRADDLIESLMKYRPETVKVQEKGNVITKNIDDIKIGDLIIIDSGVRIPVDGVVTSGQASIDESTLTGESVPITKNTGDMVFSPTLNTSGSLLIKATKVAGESTLAKIIAMVSEASVKKARIVKIATKFTGWYVLATLLGAIAIYLFTGNVLFVLSILLVVCADDIAVSIPLTFTVAVARASEHGILIKSADVLEKVSKIETFISDKTGTLTFGKPKIVEINTFDGYSKNDFLKYLVATEAKSNHPIAKTVIEYAKNQNIKIVSSVKPKESPGEGVGIEIGSKKILAGKAEFLEKNGIIITSIHQKEIIEFSEKGLSLILLAVNKNLVGLAAFEDKIRPSAFDLVRKTKEMGVKNWIMLTGDNPIVAKRVSEQVGITEFETSLTPKEKLDFIEKTKSKGKNKNVAMIGDGVNDAAALAISDVSIAMGAIGSDAAINAADISLMDDNLSKIPGAMQLGIETGNIVNQIFIIWAITNITGLILVFTGVLTPTGAATYNFLTDFLPIFNALRVGTKIKY